MGKQFWVYILADEPYGTLYVGVTSDLCGRVCQPKAKEIEGFTKRYGVDRLIWFEEHGSAETAIRREKQIKRWRREWKINLIHETNRPWDDLYDGLFG